MAWVYLVLAIVSCRDGRHGKYEAGGGFHKIRSLGVGGDLLRPEHLSPGPGAEEDRLGVAYAIWSGVGTALIAAVGILWFKEPATALKLASLTLIVAGVVGLNLGGAY